MGTIKDIYDIAKDSTPYKRWLSERSGNEEERRILLSFSETFKNIDPDKTTLLDYFDWNEQTDIWTIGDGNFYGTSYGELASLWLDPSLYGVFESSLLRYKNRGGKIYRTFVVSDEYFREEHRITLIRTCLRESILGFEPYIAHRHDIDHCVKDLGISCTMFNVANSKIAYFTRVDPVPCILRTEEQKYITAARKAFLEFRKNNMSFQNWLKKSPFSIVDKSIYEEIEREAELIRHFAGVK